MIKTLFILIGIGTIISTQAQDETDWRLYKPTTEEVKAELRVDDADELEQEVDDSKDSTKVMLTMPAIDKPGKKGEIRYLQDERILVLDEYLKTHPIKHNGYRIQLIFGSRGVVSSARSKFLGSYNHSAYEDYLPPNFRLRVGDFLTRFQAEKVLREIKGRFPSAYIVRDKIEVPREYR